MSLTKRLVETFTPERQVGEIWKLLKALSGDDTADANLYDQLRPSQQRAEIWDAIKSIVDSGVVGGVISNTIYVDTAGSSGSGTTGSIGDPFDTPEEAATAAGDSDVIVINTGTFTVSSNLCKAGGTRTIVLQAGSVLNMNTTNVNMFDDAGQASVLRLYGTGIINYTTSTGQTQVTGGSGFDGAIFRLTHASTDFEISSDIIFNYFTTSNNAPIAIIHVNGTWNARFKFLYLNALKAGAACLACGIYWENGPHKTECHGILPGASNVGATGYNIWAAPIAGTMTGTMFVKAMQITGGGNPSFPTISHRGANAAARVWIESILIEYVTASDFSFFPYFYGVDCASGFLYINGAQKIASGIVCNGGVLYVNTQKLALYAANEFLVYADAGEMRLELGHVDDAHTQVSDNNCIFRIAGGNHYIKINDAVRTTVGHGILIDDGTLRFGGVLKTAVSTTLYNPVIKAGANSNLILDNARLVAGGSRASIDATSAQTVQSVGSFANTDVDGDITIQGGLVINSALT